jgi:hypothetical protein
VSPDPEQVSEFNKHAAPIRYFPAWTEADILAAAKFMTSSPLTDEEYSLLMKSLGPNPRALFPQDSSAVFPAAITLLEEMTTMVDGDSGHILKVVNGLLDGSSPWDSVTSDLVKPISKLMMITRSEGDDFTTRNVAFRSDAVRHVLDRSIVSTVLNKVFYCDSFSQCKAELGHTFELLVFALAYTGAWEGSLTCLTPKATSVAKAFKFTSSKSQKSTQLSERQIVLNASAFKKGTFFREVYRRVRELKYVAVNEKGNVLELNEQAICIGSNLPLFDCAGARNVWFDATVGASKTLKTSLIQITLDKLDIEGGEEQVHLVYILPPDSSHSFKWNVMQDTEEDDALSPRVSVYTVEVPPANDDVWKGVTKVLRGRHASIKEETLAALKRSIAELGTQTSAR